MARSGNSGDAEPLRAAQGRLASALGMLDAFSHRNKNQHRSSRWWGPFDMLRRCVRRLVLPPAQRTRRRQRAAGSLLRGGGGWSETSTTALRTRTRWLLDHALPRAYLAFTQLAADNQYAPLGLLLLGILAQIYTVASSLGIEPSSVEPVDASALPGGSGAGTGAALDDMGVAVARGRDRRDNVQSPPFVLPAGLDHPLPPDGHVSSVANAEKAALPRAEVSAKKKRAGTVKKREGKKKKKEDEFDDLFSSLI